MQSKTTIIIAILGFIILGMASYIGVDKFQSALNEQMVQATSDARQQGREELLISIYDTARARGQVSIAKPVVNEEGEAENAPTILLQVVPRVTPPVAIADSATEESLTETETP